jgi:hypothetical protein
MLLYTPILVNYVQQYLPQFESFYSSIYIKNIH